MSFLDTIKKKIVKKPAQKTAASKVAEKKSVQKTNIQEPAVSVASSRGPREHYYTLLRNPYITEKSSVLQAAGKYVFKVAPSANKIELAKAIQHVFGVTPIKINISRKPARKVRLGAREGKVPGFKKAIVTLKEGDKIDVGA